MQIIIIMNAIGGLLILAGILLNLPWRKWLEKRFGDNPDKARVQIFTGIHKLLPTNGERVRYKKYAISYQYKDLNGKNATVVLPKKYPEIYVNSRRWVWVVAGDLFASLPGERHEYLNHDQKEFDTLVGSRLAVDIVNSVTGKKTAWLIIAIIVGVAVLGYFFYSNVLKKPETPIESTTNQTAPFIQPLPTSGTPWEVK